MKLLLTPTAYADLNRLYSFLSIQYPKALKMAALRIKQAFNILKKHPRSGYILTKFKPETREFLIPFGHGHYVVRYRINAKKIQILHLWHSKEKRPEL
ncbi:type II toxin-antitoxin system RelE/ParE family toxin [bacterium]|nr:type II toxin-antitoxin system RelE/ParE family toxin [bacterium]